MLKFILTLILLCCVIVTNSFALVMTPSGEMVQYYGREIFYSESIKVDIFSDNVRLRIFTNFPLNEVSYNKSDLYLRISDKKSLGIKMFGHNKGNILLNPVWETTESFVDIGEYCRDISGEYIRVIAKDGVVIGKAVITEDEVTPGKWMITVLISRKILEGKDILVSWATARCGNSLVSESFYVEKRDIKYCSQSTYTISPEFKNDNPVVPYYTGMPYMSYFGGFWDGGIPFGGYYYPYYKKQSYNCVQTPIGRSLFMVGSGLIPLLRKR
jgi:hypothetical protein